MRQVFLGAGCSQTKWKVAFGKQSANKWTAVFQDALVERYRWHCASEAAGFHPCICVCARSRSRTARRDNMAKIYSEKAFLNRHQRSSSKTPDEELAVIENGDSRLAAQSKHRWITTRLHFHQWGGYGTVCHICPPGLTLFVRRRRTGRCLQFPTETHSEVLEPWPGTALLAVRHMMLALLISHTNN